MACRIFFSFFRGFRRLSSADSVASRSASMSLTNSSDRARKASPCFSEKSHDATSPCGFRTNILFRRPELGGRAAVSKTACPGSNPGGRTKFGNGPSRTHVSEGRMFALHRSEEEMMK